MKASSDRAGIFYGYVIVAACCFSTAPIFGVHHAFGVLFKPLSASFGWTRSITAGALSLVWIVQGALSIVMGGLNDRFGPRMVLTIGSLHPAQHLSFRGVEAQYSKLVINPGCS